MQDSATSFTQSSWKDSRWMMWVLVIVVSADSLLRVFAKWRSYDYLTRADAAVFALLLLAFPLRLILGFRSGKLETEQIVVFAYIIILMLVTMLGH
jgi:hypothetical protein